MSFEYQQYVRGCFTIPALVIISLSAILIYEVYSHRKQADCKDKQKGTAKLIIIFLTTAFLLSVHAGRLFHGGIHLIAEKEHDAIEMQGEIEKIEALGDFSFPKIKGELGYEDGNGVEFSINGIECTAVAKGELEVGDYVSVVYLPKSGYILHIEELERD